MNKTTTQGAVKSVFLIDPKDLKFEGDTIIGMKRKYGEHKRSVHKIVVNEMSDFERYCTANDLDVNKAESWLQYKKRL